MRSTSLRKTRSTPIATRLRRRSEPPWPWVLGAMSSMSTMRRRKPRMRPKRPRDTRNTTSSNHHHHHHILHNHNLYIITHFCNGLVLLFHIWAFFPQWRSARYIITRVCVCIVCAWLCIYISNNIIVWDVVLQYKHTYYCHKNHHK